MPTDSQPQPLPLGEYTRPDVFARALLKRPLYPWQANVLRALDPPGARVALVTPNESGKTAEVITNAIIWHMYCFPGSLTVTMSASNRQVKQQLYPNLHARLDRVENWQVRSSNEYSVRGPNNSMCVSFATDDPGLAEGFHERDVSHLVERMDGLEKIGIPDGYVYTPEKSLLIILDEAKTIPVEMFQAVDRCHPTRYLVASTPGEEPDGPFYDCFHTASFMYDCHRVAVEDCPHLWDHPRRRAELEALIRYYGEDSAYVESMVFGRFPKVGANAVFRMPDVDTAMGGLIAEYGAGTVRAAVDLSGGGDEICMFVRWGNRSRQVYSSHEADATVLTDELIAEFERYLLRPEWVTVDEGGMGDPVCDLLSHRGWPVRRLNFASQPRQPKKYRNTRAEIMFELSHAISAGWVSLPNDRKLRDQLSWHKYKRNDNGQLTVLPKEKMPNSPDRADTVAMLYYGMPAPARAQEGARDYDVDDADARECTGMFARH